MYLGNATEDPVVVRAMARKSFALGLYIQDYNGRPLDINGCVIRIVMRKNVPSSTVDDSANLITNSTAANLAPLVGFARFEFQATDLDHKPGEYMYTVVMIDDTGFSTVLLHGPFELIQNTEFSSLSDTYTTADAFSQAIAIQLREQSIVQVRTGPTLAPGETTFTFADEQKLDQLYAGALADGQVLNADDIADGLSKVMMTTAERALLAGGLDVAWDDITGKPDFGTAATSNTEDFLAPGGVAGEDVTSGMVGKDYLPAVVDLNGIVVTTSAPSGGNPGRITLKYTP
jgi:hypothetical protein